MTAQSHGCRSLEAQDQLVPYLLGDLAPDSARSFEEHLETCDACQQEVSSLEPIVSDLVLAVPPTDPPPGLKERVMASVGKPPRAFLPSAERTWHPSDVPGVEISVLWSDPATERHTTLVRMAAGTFLPAHRHGGAEECLVVEGDLRDGRLLLGAGDYVRHDEGTQHQVMTRNGCLLLVKGSFHDQRVAPN